MHKTSTMVLLWVFFHAWAQSPAIAVESCGKVVGKDIPRIRSSNIRMVLADPGAAAARFLPFAVMSALAYEEAGGCKHPRALKHREQLLALIADWTPVVDLPDLPPCDDDFGLFYRVWQRERPDAVEVVLAFRGTGPHPDWWHGNLHGLKRFFTDADQYTRSRERARALVDYFRNGAGRPKSGKPVRFYSTGHSLGGGLAQNVLYDQPEEFLQVFAFNPSPVTGYLDQEKPKRRKGCTCLPRETEARIYRIYESGEILAWLRYPLKLTLPLNRHLQEVRFGFGEGNGIAQHAMETFAVNLAGIAGESLLPWYTGELNECTDKFIADLQGLCDQERSTRVCPP